MRFHQDRPRLTVMPAGKAHSRGSVTTRVSPKRFARSRAPKQEQPMPEFNFDLGSRDAARAYNALDDFTQGYIGAMFFTDGSDPDDRNLEHATFAELAPGAQAIVAELAPGALRQIVADCARFQAVNRADLDEATDNGRIKGYDDKAAGRDFWFTRNHHDVGFWDRGFGEVGRKLTNASHAFGEVSLYRSDDGLRHSARLR
jgi:hypothetical protein